MLSPVPVPAQESLPHLQQAGRPSLGALPLLRKTASKSRAVPPASGREPQTIPRGATRASRGPSGAETPADSQTLSGERRRGAGSQGPQRAISERVQRGASGGIWETGA
jgi:hypothetical protein